MADRPRKALKLKTKVAIPKRAAAVDDHGHSHDHGHEPAGPPPERPPGRRPAETGGDALQLDLAALLPGETDEHGRFERLDHAVSALPGVLDAHLRVDAGHPELCVHFDPGLVDSDSLIPEVRTIASRVAHRYRMATWFVREMDSAQCAAVVEHVLRRTPGILTADVAYAAERLVVEYDVDLVKPAQIEAQLKAVGYPLLAVVPGEAASGHGHTCGLAPKNGMRLVGLAGALLAVGGALSFGGVLLPLTPWVFAAALVAGGWYPGQAAFRALRAGQVDIEGLMVLAAIGAGALGAWAEGAFLLFLFSLGHALEHRAMDRARRAIDALGKLRPDTARVKKAGAIVEVSVSRVRRGDRVVVRPGDRVPLDGLVREGRSTVDQATLTGESVPVEKAAGDEVFAGTINVDGALEIEVSRPSTESSLAKLVDLVSRAEANKSPTQRLSAKIERTFVPIVLVAAPLLSAILYLGAGLSLRDAVLRGISLLVAASPCALAISTPAAVLSAVARGAQSGVLIKGGGHLHALGNVSTLAFDKTGTLTVGKPRLVSVVCVQGDEASLLRAAAAVESVSAHPLAAAITRGASERGISAIAADDCVAVHGKGIRGQTPEGLVEAGNAALFENELPAPVADAIRRLHEAGQTTIIVRQAGTWLGVLGVADTLRPEAAASLRALTRLGIGRTVMLSGDHERVANVIATSVGITDVRAPLLPDGKVKAVRELARSGGVAMVGDGVNDAPALASASVGIAMGGAGSDVALETADIVLMADDLRKLPLAVGLARAATRVIHQNLTIALGVSLILVLASIFGWVQISSAVVLHEGSTLVVVANGLRLLWWREPASGADDHTLARGGKGV